MTGNSLVLADSNVAGACSSALRKVGTLAELAPSGRLFAAISTLSETALQVNEALAEQELAQAANLLGQYAEPAALTDVATPLPIHFKRQA